MRTFLLRTSSLALFVVLVGSSFLQAQQDPQFTMYMFNKLPFNPGYAGIEGVWGTKVHLRNQWLGFEGHPVTQGFATDIRVKNWKNKTVGFGAGLVVLNDKLGAEATTNLALNLNYQRAFSFGRFSLGASVGWVQKSLDGSILRSATGVYENGVVHMDPSIPDGDQNGGTVDFGAGLYFAHDDFWIGVAATHLTEPEVVFETGIGSTVSTPLGRNIYAMAGYDFDINIDYTLKPSVMMKTDAVKTQFDIDLLIDYQTNIWGGLGIRGVSGDSRDAILGILGLKLTEQLMFGYSYDLTTSSIKNYSSGSHEFILGYKLVPPEKIKKHRIIRGPRFL